jgi:hypothetical protein
VILKHNVLEKNPYADYVGHEVGNGKPMVDHSEHITEEDNNVLAIVLYVIGGFVLVCAIGTLAYCINKCPSSKNK